MIVWGSGGDVIDLGTADTRPCETCEKDRQFNVRLHYRYWALYWVFGCVTEKQYAVACDVCSRGWEIDAEKIEPTLTASPIPFMHRYGLMIIIGAIAVLMFLTSLG